MKQKKVPQIKAREFNFFLIMLPKHVHGLQNSRNIESKYLFHLKAYFHVLDHFV